MADHARRPPHVPPHHRPDIGSEPGIVILRRSRDGTEVARFGVRGVAWGEILGADGEYRGAIEED